MRGVRTTSTGTMRLVDHLGRHGPDEEAFDRAVAASTDDDEVGAEPVGLHDDLGCGATVANDGADRSCVQSPSQLRSRRPVRGPPRTFDRGAGVWIGAEAGHEP